MAFNSNAMAELAAISRDRYQRNGGGGAHKVHVSSRAYYDARGFKEMSAFDRALVQARDGFRQAASLAAEHFRMDCLIDREGFYHGETIPF